MEHTQKMVVVPQDLLDNLRYNQAKKAGPVGKQLIGIDKDVNHILSREDLAQEDKIRLYQELMLKYADINQVKKKQLVEAPPPDIMEDEWVDRIDTHFGVQNRAKARNLLDWIRTKGDLTWNDKGEVQGLPDSNILTLLDEMTRQTPRDKNVEPTGMAEFATKLKAINVPRYLISNHYQKYWTTTPRRIPPLTRVDSSTVKRVPTPEKLDFGTPSASPPWLSQP